MRVICVCTIHVNERNVKQIEEKKVFVPKNTEKVNLIFVCVFGLNYVIVTPFYFYTKECTKKDQNLHTCAN